MVPPYSDRIPRVPPYSSSSQHVHFCVRGCHPVSRAFPDASTNTHTDSGSGLLPVRSPLLGESRFPYSCLLYTSDAADDLLCVDLGGRRIIKKKKIIKRKMLLSVDLLYFFS
eukprot:TRINITY_DN931_c0_g1_i3.p1 TRINITY_DN931_c0_g1~~TRINITY_DN931_c0_g1_i3.p1  ORF type:complete len:112 (+),score=10.48 TRINITY_DN931_c0_g1_i3:210-545(+)